MTQTDTLRRAVAARRPATAKATPSNAVTQQKDQEKQPGPGTLCYQFLMDPKQISAVSMALPRGMDAHRFMRIVWTECRKNPALVHATPDSLFQACITAAQLGLEVGSHLGQCYLVPFTVTRKTREGGWVNIPQAQLIIGYKGLIALARKSGEMVSLNAYVVHEKDQFSYQLGLHPDIQHIPSAEADPGPITFVYAVANFVGGGVQFEVMSRAEIEAVRDASQGWKSAQASAKKYGKPAKGPWAEHFSEMARKTVVRRLAKYLPLSVEAARAVAVDEAADRGDVIVFDDDDYIKNGGEPPAYEGDFDDIEETPVPAEDPAPVPKTAPAAIPNQQTDVPPAPPFPMDEADLASMSPADIKRRAASKE